MSNITPDFDNLLDDSNMFASQNFYDQNYYHQQMVQRFTTSQKEYQIHLRVKAATEPHQSIVVIGSIPEVGKWDKTKPVCRLQKQSDGQYWHTESPITTGNYYFSYKYVIWDNNSNKMVSWERGIDRIIDAEILDDYHGKSTIHNFAFNSRPGKNTKCVILDEIFEAFYSVFSVNVPNPDLVDIVQIVGNNNIQS